MGAKIDQGATAAAGAVPFRTRSVKKLSIIG